MFKPAEEMVYIGLDEQSRTKGKAAIDVAGAQTGKSIGSVLQQVTSSFTTPATLCCQGVVDRQTLAQHVVNRPSGRATRGLMRHGWCIQVLLVVSPGCGRQADACAACN